MANILDDDGLTELFDLDLDDIEEEINIDSIDDNNDNNDDIDDIEIENDYEEIEESNEEIITDIEIVEDKTIVKSETKNDIIEEDENKDFVNDHLKKLLKTSDKLMDMAVYLIDSAANAETIASASNLISSTKDIISEINKSVLVKTRFNEQAKLEKMKIEARQNLAEFKAATGKQKIDMGSGNTFIQNTEQNLVSSYSQEDIVDMIQNIKDKSDNQITE